MQYIIGHNSKLWYHLILVVEPVEAAQVLGHLRDRYFVEMNLSGLALTPLEVHMNFGDLVSVN